LIMGEKKEFDLTALIGFGHMDVRGIAAADPQLTAAEYFDRLSLLCDDMPAAREALGRIANFKNNREDIPTLEGIKGTLERCGCRKLIPDIKGILEVLAKGNKGLAANRTRDILADWDKAYNQTLTAIKEPSDNGGESITLKELLDRTDVDDETRKPRILAVDDAAVVLRTLLGILNNDYTVYMLSKPVMLEKILQNIVPDLFLLDYEMPEVNGFDLVPIIRSFPEHRDTPIIFLTEKGTIDNISTAVLLGACDFMVKPFEPDTLREKVAKHIVKKKR